MRKGDIKTMLIGTAITALMYSGGLSAGDISNNVFAVKEAKILSVMDDNKPFIEKDEINYFASINIAEELSKGSNGKTSAINVIHKNDKNLQFRKEVALHADGHLELTVKMRFFPFTDNSEPKNASYSFLVPLKVLDGMKFKAAVGRTANWKWSEGSFNAKIPDGNILSQCRYIVLQDGKNNGYTFDFNPYGPGSRKDWSEYGEAGGYWSIYKEGEYIKFSTETTFKYYGGLFACKMLIYKGVYDFDKKHALNHWTYTSINAKDIKSFQFTFGTPGKKESFTVADCNVYSPERKWGWKDGKNLKILRTDDPDIIGNCVFSSNGAADEFIVDLCPGAYLISIRCGHNTLKTGPFNISLNGKTVLENIETSPGETKTINLTDYIRAPETKLKIGFSGKNMWSLRSIIIQALIYQNEDFSIDRSFWVMDKLFSPEIE